MSITDLLNNPRRRAYAAMPEMDALVEVDALQEADLVDVRVDSDHSSVALLFDLRTALQFRLANTAVLVLRNVDALDWSPGEADDGRRVAHYVMNSRPGTDRQHFTLELVCLRGRRLNARASAAEFFVGDVPGLPEAPPNFSDNEPVIAAAMPMWKSSFTPGWATFFDPPESEAR